MVVETSDKNQYFYFYILNLFLKMTWPDQVWYNIAQLLNATHLLVMKKWSKSFGEYSCFVRLGYFKCVISQWHTIAHQSAPTPKHLHGHQGGHSISLMDTDRGDYVIKSIAVKRRFE